VTRAVTGLPEPVLFCWSGGKDSAMALHALQQDAAVRVVGLLTTVTEEFERVTMHGVRRELLAGQAAALGLPLHEVRIPPQCANSVYEERMQEALHVYHEQGVRRVAFGDIFLEELRAYRERNLARMEMQAVFPLWKRETHSLAREFLEQGFRAMAVCVDGKLLDRSFAGRALDAAFFRDLPPHVDPCGENGEFHTFVFDGPNFRSPIAFHMGEVVERESFYFCDLLPEEKGERQ